MTVVWAPHRNDVPHTMIPYTRWLLSRYEAICIDPYAGLDHFGEFGERIYVYINDLWADCGLGWRFWAAIAVKHGLSLVVPNRRIRKAARRYWPRTKVTTMSQVSHEECAEPEREADECPHGFFVGQGCPQGCAEPERDKCHCLYVTQDSKTHPYYLSRDPSCPIHGAESERGGAER